MRIAFIQHRLCSGGAMKTRYYFLLTVATLMASSAGYAANTTGLKEWPRSVMQSRSRARPAVVTPGKPTAAASTSNHQKTPAKPNDSAPPKKVTPPKVVKPPQVVKPPKAPKPPSNNKPPAPPKKPEPPYVPPVRDNPQNTVTVPEPGTAALFIAAFGLLLMFQRVRRPVRSLARV
jgi:hypothetical protein